jgi:hypothetical protein
MTFKSLIINLLFGATFFNHLHALSFIPQHNRPLLLLFFPVFLIFIHRYKVRFSYNLILWICTFFSIAIGSILYNLFFGEFELFFPEIINRVLSYLVSFYFIFIGIIFWQNRKIISDKFYTFFIIVGIIQIYSMLRFPFSNLVTNLFDNYLIKSFASVGNYILFFEAEPSYVAFMIIFLMVIFEHRNKSLWVLFAILTFSLRTTIISVMYYIKKRPFIYGFIIIAFLTVGLSKFQISYSVYSRTVALITFQTLDPSSYIRIVKNKAAVQIINDNPIFGVGPGQFSTYYTSKYISNYDTRGFGELESALVTKDKTIDPYSFILGLVAELGLFGLIGFTLPFYYLFKHSNRKYLLLLILFILFWGYPFGKPYIWILLGYIYQEYQLLKINKINRLLN